MQAARLLFITAISIPQLAWSNYDPVKIKNAISDQTELFAISGWQEGEASSWTATTSQKWVSISVSPERSELVSPYFNPALIKTSKKRCAELAAIGLSVHSEEGNNTIADLIDKSTQHHRIEYLELNGARFEVIPKVVGPFVRLFCTIKPVN